EARKQAAFDSCGEFLQELEVPEILGEVNELIFNNDADLSVENSVSDPQQLATERVVRVYRKMTLKGTDYTFNAIGSREYYADFREKEDVDSRILGFSLYRQEEGVEDYKNEVATEILRVKQERNGVLVKEWEAPNAVRDTV